MGLMVAGDFATIRLGVYIRTAVCIDTLTIICTCYIEHSGNFVYGSVFLGSVVIILGLLYIM